MSASALSAQGTGIIRGRVLEAAGNRPIGDAQVLVDGTTMRATTNAAGEFTIPGVPAGPRAVSARRIGFAPGTQRVEVVAGQTATVSLLLNESASQIEGVVVSAFGESAAKRGLGTSSQTVSGSAVAETQRENFLNALQGRVAGVQVNSTSGVPGASSQITIRGVSSISSSNQPLFVIDGMPMDNKTLNSGVLASSFGGSTVSFENRGVDFTNRAADINPEDIESITVLKGPEAAALYGIDAANGAIVITTKRGTTGGGFEYNNSFRIESVREAPEVQRVYGPADSLNFNFRYWGPQYAPGTRFFNNVGGFFQNALTQRHNLAFSGASPDNRVNYRVTGAGLKQQGVVPTTAYDRYNVTGAGQAQATKWMQVDLTTAYSYTDNRQPFKGLGTVTVGPLIALLAWPQTDDASNWLTPAGTRRRVTNQGAGGEIDNPYFNVEKNHINSTNNRILVNLGLRFTPFAWGNIKTQVGTDAYANHNEILRHPESAYGAGNGGQIDVADDNTRNLSAQALLNVNRQDLAGRFGVTGLVGTSAQDNKSNVDALWGSQFLESEFVSINNTTVNRSKTTIAQRRLQSVFGQATFDYANYLFLTVSGRNDWTSTIPVERNSFFYPSVSGSFVFSDAFPSLGEFMTGKLRAAYAEVGRDATPYAYRPSLQYKTTSFGGYGYDFWGPNFKLRPEFAHSYEVGTELGFFDDRLGVDATVYRKETRDQIVQNIRGTYATGFILFNLNGASTRNTGLELTVRGMPVRRQDATWEVIGNFDKSRGIVLALPNALPESY
ncbi:MAG: SusC/RagA family TonB-linked outer membrane protein, partial [Gemmatimonadaceae bacterium]